MMILYEYLGVEKYYHYQDNLFQEDLMVGGEVDCSRAGEGIAVVWGNHWVSDEVQERKDVLEIQYLVEVDQVLPYLNQMEALSKRSSQRAKNSANLYRIQV